MELALSRPSGWICVALVVASALLPIGYRVANKRRATPESGLVRGHVVAGLATAALAFAHALTILPALGSPEAIGAGTLSLAAGSAAFFVLFAHVGVGLQLRSPTLKTRAKKRRTHVATALVIVAAIALHVVLLRLG